MTQFPTLDYFFSVYLGEDWPDDYGSEWAAIDAFISEGPPEDPQLFRAEIATLLAEHTSEDEVRKIVLDDLDSCLVPEVNGWKYRDWLQALSDHVAKATGHPQAS
jgi:contact-dependent growth inhibition (CDI) system CdiI-like immunity protein